MVGAVWIRRCQFRGRGHRRNGDQPRGPGLVSDAYETGVEPAGLVVRTGLDSLIYRHGGGRLVGLATGGVDWGTVGGDSFYDATDSQCRVVNNLLWIAKSRRGCCGGYGLVGCDSGDAGVILASQRAGGNPIHSVPGLGQFCRSPEFCNLEAESSLLLT